MGFDLLGAVTGGLGAVDVTGKVVDVLGSAAGLSPEVTNIAKIVVGTATGNPITAASGAAGLAGNILDTAAQTEFSPSKSDPTAGYGGVACGPGSCPMAISNSPALPADLMGHLMFDIYKKLNESDRMLGEKVGELLLDGKHEQGWKNINDAIHGYNDQVGAALFGIPAFKAKFEKTYECKVDPHSVNSGEAKISGDYSRDWTNPQSPLDPNITKYREAIDVLRANWATFDTASSGRDGLVTRADIAAIAGNPNASATMREAAQFLIDNPEYFNRLEMAAGVNGKDGLIGFVDLTAEVKRINEQIAEYGVPEKSSKSSSANMGNGGSSGTSGGGSKLSGIMNDPNMTLEEKLEALMDAITSDIDEELGDTMKELDAAYGKSTKGSDGKEDASKAQEKQGAIDKITRKLQQLMERRKQMVELASNMSKNFNDMAMTAIRNMR